MRVKCVNCGFEHNVAGLYRRRENTRPSTRGVVLSDGSYEWGRYQCDGCDQMITVPEWSEEKEQGSKK